MPLELSLTAALVALATVLYVGYTKFYGQDSLKLPPSPPGALPYLGHLTSVADPVQMRLNLLKWGKQFEHVFTFTVGPRRFLILNSERAISDLYCSKGSIYSSRPLDAVSMAFFSEKSTAFTPYGKMHRYARSLINRTFGPNTQNDEYVRSLIIREARKLIDVVKVKSPLPGFDLGEELGRASISTVWAMIFSGDSIDPDQVPLICDALRGFSKVAGMGSRLVALFPFLAKFGVLDNDIKAAGQARDRLIDLIAPRYFLALDRVRKERLIDAGSLPASELDRAEAFSHARTVAEAQLDGKVDKERAVWLIVGLLSASIDTTGSSLHFALSFVAENPEVQEKAHALLDRVVGRDHPPSFSDTGLEYVRAIVKEATRLWPVSPTGMPRMTDEDDVYEGYHIPKGTTVFMNLRHLQISDSTYDEPREFNPERWLAKPGSTPSLDLQDSVKPFGTGRRVCPGIHVATEVMYMLTAHMLWAFTVSHRDRKRKAKTVDDIGYGTIIVGPSDADLVFEPRV